MALLSAISGDLGGLFYQKFRVRYAPTDGGAPLRWYTGAQFYTLAPGRQNL